MTITTDGSGTANKVTVNKVQSGFVAVGTGGFYSAQFDDFAIHTGIYI